MSTEEYRDYRDSVQLGSPIVSSICWQSASPRMLNACCAPSHACRSRGLHRSAEYTCLMSVDRGRSERSGYIVSKASRPSSFALLSASTTKYCWKNGTRCVAVVECSSATVVLMQLVCAPESNAGVASTLRLCDQLTVVSQNIHHPIFEQNRCLQEQTT